MDENDEDSSWTAAVAVWSDMRAKQNGAVQFAEVGYAAARSLVLIVRAAVASKTKPSKTLFVAKDE